MYHLNIKLNDFSNLLSSKELNLQYNLKVYYLCNNDSYTEFITTTESNDNQTYDDNNEKIINFENLFSRKTQKALKQHQENSNCSSVLLSEHHISNPFDIVTIKNLHNGKYSIELIPNMNESTYCKNTKDKCAYEEYGKIKCAPCKKIVYFFDPAYFKPNKKINKSSFNNTNNKLFKCVQNSKKFINLESFYALTSYNSYNGSLILYQNQTIFNLNESFVVSLELPLSVSLDITYDSMCSSRNLFTIKSLDDLEEDVTLTKLPFPIAIIYVFISFICLIIFAWILYMYDGVSFCYSNLNYL